MTKQQLGFSLLKTLPWLLVIALACLFVWVAKNPKQNGETLQSYLPQSMQVAPTPTPTTPPTQTDQQAVFEPVPAPPSNPTHDNTPVSSYHDAVTLASQSVVNIYTTKKIQNPYADDPVLSQLFEYHGQGRGGQENNLGSGVIVSDDGYIVTNVHVIEQADDIVVVLNDGRKAHAKVIGQDKDSDLAVIKIELDNIKPLAFRTTPIRVGDVALAIGNPFGVGQTVTQGIISATGRAGLGVSMFEDFIQTDAAINPGNSGGALVDADGALIGINTMIYTRSGGSVGIGFAIPTSIVKQVMNGIIKDGKVSRGWLGMEVARSNAPADLSNQTGVQIAHVGQNTPAQQAGLQAGDVILAINDMPTNDPNTLIGIISKSTPNTSLSLTIKRGNEQHQLTAITAERPTFTAQNQQSGEVMTPEEMARLQEFLRQMERFHRQ